MLSKKFTAVAGATAAAAADDYFKNTTLLLSGDGTNGAQNNTFTDSSTNNFTITRNGNTTQGTFSPYSPAGSSWSNYFDGSSYLTTASNPVPATGNFTVEFWIYSNGANTHIFGYGASGGFLIQISGGYVLFGQYGVGTYTSSTLLPTNQFVHIAVVRNSSSWVLYQNGVSVATATWNPTLSGGNVTVAGGAGGGAGSLTGYISNLRLVNNATIYTGAFTPPTTPLTDVSGTQILICQSNRFVDATGNQTLTVSGTPSVQRFNPFNPTSAYSTSTVGGSGYFDGSGDYLTAGSQTAYNFGTGDFTIEFWAYVTKSMTTSTVTTAIGYGTSLGSNGWAIDSGLSNGCFTWGWLTSPYTSVTTGVLPQNSWCHVAIVRSGTTLTAYLNGAVSESKSFSSSVTPTNSPTFTIGQHSSVISGREYQGYLTNVRLLNGVAAYTGAFTPPTAPLATSGSASAASYPSTTNVNTSFSSSACALLLGTTNAGIYDSAMMNDLETVGNAQISTSTKKYGTGAMYFDGTGDYLQLQTNSALSLSGDFTIEFWVYANSSSSNSQTIWCPSAIDRSIQVNGTSSYWIYWDGAAERNFGAFTSGTWAHIALTRSGTTVKGFLNGVQGFSITDSGTLTFSAGAIGYRQRTTAGNYFNGYIDDFRITNGYARYTSNFTAPTEALPNY